MDGTDKNVKMKRKANKSEKGGGSKWRRNGRYYEKMTVSIA
jgi:hypothetical protein